MNSNTRWRGWKYRDADIAVGRGKTESVQRPNGIPPDNILAACRVEVTSSNGPRTDWFPVVIETWDYEGSGPARFVVVDRATKERRRN